MALVQIQGKAEHRTGIHYEFDPSEQPLGKGGMGKVYRGFCVDDRTGSSREVAIKFMFEDLPQSVIERARREASIQLRHENLVEMLGFIETEEVNGIGEVVHHYHVVSELLEGVMLDDLLQGKLTDHNGHVVAYAQKLYNDFQRDVYRFATQIVRSVLSGLMTLHDAGYIHRDIDPTNIMVTSAGQVKLIDFGIAKQMRLLTTNDKLLTVAGAFMGKPEYAAPELVLGDIKSQDLTTDIYAVGILLFQCIVGHPPFEGDRADVLQMQLHNKLPLHLIRNSGVRRIVATATEKSRAKRYHSAAEFRVALDNLPLQLKNSPLAWKPAYSIAAAIVAACIVAGGTAALIFLGDDKPEVSYPPVPDAEEIAQTQIDTDTVTAEASVSIPQPASPPSYEDLYVQAEELYKSDQPRLALPLFEEALVAARAANDVEYIEKCEGRIQRVKKRINR